MPYMPEDQSSTMSYPTYAGGRAPFRLTGNNKKDQRGLLQSMAGNYGQTQQYGDQFDRYLNDYFGSPTGGADAFSSYYANAANAAAAPALRDFQNTVGKQAASVASRFGGNGTSEESRVIRGTSDDFSRNLTEALARVGPQAVTAAQNRGGQLLSGANAYGNRQLDQQALLDAALQRKKKSPWGKILGTAAGAVGGYFLGNPALGAQVGGSIGGSF